MKIAIIGSRSITDYQTLKQLMSRIDMEQVSEVISGGANGADELAARWAKENGKKLTELRPDYKQHGGRAPLERNKEIVNRADVVYALWDGQSKGTAHALAEAKRQGKELHCYQPPQPGQLALFD